MCVTLSSIRVQNFFACSAARFFFISIFLFCFYLGYCIIILQVSQKNGVSQTVPENVNRSEHEHVLTLDKNLVFILKYYKTVIQIGKLSAK